MGIQTIVTSDLTGKEIHHGAASDYKPYAITIKGPGDLAKDAKAVDAFLSDDDADLMRQAFDPDGVKSLKDFLLEDSDYRIRELEAEIADLKEQLERAQSGSKTRSAPSGDSKPNPLVPIREAVDLAYRGSTEQFKEAVDGFLATLDDEDKPKSARGGDLITSINVQTPQKDVVRVLDERLDEFRAYVKGEDKSA